MNRLDDHSRNIGMLYFSLTVADLDNSGIARCGILEVPQEFQGGFNPPKYRGELYRGKFGSWEELEEIIWKYPWKSRIFLISILIALSCSRD